MLSYLLAACFATAATSAASGDERCLNCAPSCPHNSPVSKSTTAHLAGQCVIRNLLDGVGLEVVNPLGARASAATLLAVCIFPSHIARIDACDPARRRFEPEHSPRLDLLYSDGHDFPFVISVWKQRYTTCIVRRYFKVQLKAKLPGCLCRRKNPSSWIRAR